MAFFKRLWGGQVWLYAKARSLRLDWYIMVSLLILSVIGVALTDAFEPFSHVYWRVMVLVLFAACLYIEWDAARKAGMPVRKLVITQVLHWLGLLVVHAQEYRRLG